MTLYKFRLRFQVSVGRRPMLEEDELLLHEDDKTAVWVRALKRGTSLEEAETWVLSGSAYQSEVEAVRVAEFWRGTLERAFAVLGICADFGDYAAKGGGFTAAALEEIFTETGQRVVNETFGIMVFPDGVPFSVIGTSADGTVTTPRERFTLALKEARSVPEMTARERLAFDLYSAADFVSHRPEARFVLLMMALEALIEEDLRSVDIQQHIDKLIQTTAESDLESGEAERLTNALRGLKRESKRQAGRRLVLRMEGRLYDDKTPVEFFNECYGVRSALVHGAASRPPRHLVSRMAAKLHLLVGDLIAGRALVEAVS